MRPRTRELVFQLPSSPSVSDAYGPVFLWLKIFGFYAHDPLQLPKIYEPSFATFYAAFLITTNIFLFAFNVSAVEKSVSEDGFWKVPTTSFVIAAVRPVHCAFNLGLFKRGYIGHQQFFQQIVDIGQFFHTRLRITPNANVIRFSFVTIACTIVLIPLSLSACQLALVSNTDTNWTVSDALSLVFNPIQYLWQLLPLLYYGHINCLFLYWYRSLHSRVDNDWEDYDRRRRRPLEFYSIQYTKLTQAVLAAGEFFHPIIVFSIIQSTIVLCLAAYFKRNADTLFDDGDRFVIGIFCSAWTALQIFVAVFYVLIVCLVRWQLKLRACALAANILSCNRRSSRVFKDYSSMRDSTSTLSERRRQWRRRCRSECQAERQHQGSPYISGIAVEPRRRVTLLSIPRPFLPNVWSTTMSTRRRQTIGLTYL